MPTVTDPRRQPRQFMTRVLFTASILILLALLTLADGGESSWSQALFAILMTGLLAVHLVWRTVTPGSAPIPWARFRWPLALFGLLALWVLLQGLGQPLGAHPLWTRAAEILNTDAPRRITIDRDATASSFLFWISSGAVFALGYLTSRRRDIAMLALWGVAGLCSLYGILAILSYTTGGTLFGWGLDNGILAGPFTSKNSFATFLGVGLLAVVTLASALLSDAASAPAWKRMSLQKILARLDALFWICVSLALLLFVTLLLAQSRGATLAFGASLVATMIMMVWARMLSGRVVGLMALGLGIPLAIGGIFSVVGLAGRFDRLGLFDFGRGDVYIATWHAIQDAWPMGTGAGAFMATFPMYRYSTWGIINEWEYAHNGYLETMLGLGMPFSLVLAALLGWIVWQLARSLWFRRARLFAIAGLSITILMALHAVTDFSLQIAGVTMLYAYLLGVCLAQTGVGNKAS